MFTLVWAEAAAAEFRRLEARARASLDARQRGGKTKSSKAEGLFKQVLKATQLLAENPKHPGLQTHEYHSMESPYGTGEKVFEAYAQNRTPGAYRIFWCYGPRPKHITIIAITPHP